MKVRSVAIAVFYDNDLNILVQERGEHSRLGEKYGFFGGRIEEGETPESAIKRELLEEIGYIPEKLEYWLKDSYKWEKEGRYKGWTITCHVFLSPITLRLGKAKISEGEGKIKLTLEEVLSEDGFPEGSTKFLQKLKTKLGK
ncbi:NUDIX domain-containing protein [Candidatus Shapirobacteria bacterium]|nr:NUDIX domain-containing protein [Candidatus Shapirobacteria bacterium]